MSHPVEPTEHAVPDPPTGARCAPWPAAIERLRRDPHGLPVPVTVPWEHGRPKFARLSAPRALIVAHHRLCAVCGLALDGDEPIWRTSDGDMLPMYEAVRNTGGVIHGGLSVEPGGHRECILFAAVACPYLSNPEAVRRMSSGRGIAVKGELRGEWGMLLAHAGYDLLFDDSGPYLSFGGTVDWVAYRDGSELTDALIAATAEAPVRHARPGVPDLATAVEEDALESLAIDIVHTISGPRQVAPRVGRNAPCTCGSGRKYKHCCLATSTKPGE